MLRLFAMICSVFVLVATEAETQTVSEVQQYSVWANEVNSFSVSAIGRMETAIEAEEILVEFLDGNLTSEGATQALETWRQSYREVLQEMRSTALRLSAGPGVNLANFSGGEEMLAQPMNVLLVVEDFFETADSYFTATISGGDPDPYPYMAAQYLVLASYMESIAGINRAAADGLDASHPQHHLLTAMTANMEMTTLTLEAARLALGAAPSRHSPADFESSFNERLAIVNNAVRAGRNAHTGMVRQIEAAQAQIPANQYNLLIAMMATYPTSFDNELVGREALGGWRIFFEPDFDPLSMDAIMNEISNYETIRDQLQMERTGLVSQLQ